MCISYPLLFSICSKDMNAFFEKLYSFAVIFPMLFLISQSESDSGSLTSNQGPKAAISRYMSIDYLLSTEHFNWTRNTPENCVQEKTPWDCRCFQNNFTLNDRQNVFLFGTIAIAEWKCPYYVLWVMTILISFSFTFPFHIKEDNVCKGCLKPSLCNVD